MHRDIRFVDILYLGRPVRPIGIIPYIGWQRCLWWRPPLDIHRIAATWRLNPAIGKIEFADAASTLQRPGVNAASGSVGSDSAIIKFFTFIHSLLAWHLEMA